MTNKELIGKIHLIAAHTYAAYAFFYSMDMDGAKKFTELSKNALEDLIAELKDELKDESLNELTEDEE